MPNSFNQSADQSAQNQDLDGQGSEFANQGNGDNQNQDENNGNPQLSAEDLVALQKRDTHAQEHIQRLEDEASARKTEMDALQVKLDRAADVDELLRNRDSGTALDADEVVAKAAQSVRDSLLADTAKERSDANFDQVSTALTEKYGDKTDDAVKLACKENDMSWDEMISLSKKNPKLAMKLCDVKVHVERAPAGGSTNTLGVLEQQGNQYQQAAPVKLMELRTDKSRVNNYTQRLDAKLKELNQN